MDFRDFENVTRETAFDRDSLRSIPAPRPAPRPIKPPEFHDAPWAPGVELNNYTTRKPSEDGTYILVESHSEHIEKIKQPLTPEEKAEKLAADKRAAKVTGVVTAGVVAVVGFLLWADYKNQAELNSAPVEKAKDEK